MRLVIQGEPHEIERVARALARLDEIPEGLPEPPRPKRPHLQVVPDPEPPQPTLPLDALAAGGDQR